MCMPAFHVTTHRIRDRQGYLFWQNLHSASASDMVQNVMQVVLIHTGLCFHSTKDTTLPITLFKLRIEGYGFKPFQAQTIFVVFIF